MTQPVADRLMDLLPVHVASRDAEAGGLLRALLEAVGAELELLEHDVEELYASWFIETCPEWVVPYLADLLGVADLPPDLSGAGGVGLSRRAFVANTLAYRQRKGTAAVIEQVARDATGWPAKAVEYFRLLVTTAHVNHVRTDRPATASVRTKAGAGRLDLTPPAVARGALDPVAHTADVRHIARLRSRHNIGNIGVFLFPDQVYESGWAPAHRSAGDRWSLHPLGRDAPLYAVPAIETTIEHLATEADLPVPLRPRRLLALLTAARNGGGDALPVAVRIASGLLGPQKILVCGLEHPASAPSTNGWEVKVDTLTGRLFTYFNGEPSHPSTMDVRFSYGATADVGAGTYDRAAVHDEVLAADPFAGTDDVAQVLVTGGGDALAEALADCPEGGTYVVAVGDNAVYTGDLSVTVPEGTRLVLVAAAWKERILDDGEVQLPVPGVYTPSGLRPQIAGLTVTGAGGSCVVLDGFVVAGDVTVEPGALGSLSVSQCTVAGTIGVSPGSVDKASNPGVVVRLVRAETRTVRFGIAAASLTVTDSVVDAPADTAIDGEGLTLKVSGSTVRGAVTVRTLEVGSSILDGPVEVEQRQEGCARYSCLPADARAPRRYRCTSVRPVYQSVDPGTPHYLTLARACPAEVAEGGEDGAEMGVHHHLRRPARVRAAARLLEPYVPVGLEIGVAGPVATARR